LIIPVADRYRGLPPYGVCISDPNCFPQSSFSDKGAPETDPRDSFRDVLAVLGSFDPVNLGHLSLIKKAVAESPNADFLIYFLKNPTKAPRLISYENSQALFLEALKPILGEEKTCLSVKMGYSDSVKDFLKSCKAHHVTHVIRGYSSKTDKVYESVVSTLFHGAKKIFASSSFKFRLFESGSEIHSSEVRKLLLQKNPEPSVLESMVGREVSDILLSALDIAPLSGAGAETDRAGAAFNQALTRILACKDPQKGSVPMRTWPLDRFETLN